MNRGQSPELLLSQIENTAPFWRSLPDLPYTSGLKKIEPNIKDKALLSTAPYFTLCLFAHSITVATYVPTDVDALIREKLWLEAMPNDLDIMYPLTIEILNWDYSPVTARGVGFQNNWMSGHHGEWFSVAVGAYALAVRNNNPVAKELLEKIKNEAQRQIKIFQDLQLARNGIDSLKASTIIAHNFGDLDRVMDQWNLPTGDPLRKLYKIANEDSAYGAMNRKHMAAENHRHLPLRGLKSLRRKQKHLLPLGPFFFNWGKAIAEDSDFSLPEIIEIARALLDGHQRLASRFPSIGYIRALAGMIEGFPGGSKAFFDELPTNLAKQIRGNEIARIWQIPENDFMKTWEKKGL